MAITELVYRHRESYGIAILVACSALSAIAILAVFFILGVSAVQSRRRSSETPFVRTKVALYFVSLLLGNLVQTVGGLLNIAWIVENRVYVGPVCTIQGALKQIGNTGPAIFTFVIAAHTFSLLFLRRPWSDRTCNIVLVVAWALLPLEICIDNYIRAGPKVKGPLYGISSYWCWISPIYLTERYTTDYLFMMVTAVLCFILYSLVFFGLRGNISVSGGYKIHFHRRPERRMSRAIDGKPVESDVTRVARHMLWYPLVYTILVLPVATARLSTFSSVSVPFPVTIFTVALFMLHGFLNTLLFCTTRRIIPGTWGQKFGLGPVLGGGRGGCDPARPAYVTWPFAIIGSIPTTLSVGVEKDVEINSEAEPSAPYVEFGSPTSPISPASATSSASPTSPTSPASPTPLLQAHVSSRHRADPH